MEAGRPNALFGAEAAAAARTLLASLSDEENEAWMRVGAVAEFWRNPIEEFHHHLSDPAMAKLTIATFPRGRAVRLARWNGL